MDDDGISARRDEIRRVLLSASPIDAQLDYHTYVFAEDGALKAGLDRGMVQVLASLTLAREIPAIFVSELTVTVSAEGSVDTIAIRYLDLAIDRREEVVVLTLPR
jgi:hypothetical protein